MSSEQKTAFLVIHGVGPHTHFQACDSFIQGFYQEYTKEYNKSDLNMKHEFKVRQNWLGNDIKWIQNYISLINSNENITIDFYEYFWDIYMTHKASFKEVYKALIRASQGARKFYEEYPQMMPAATDLGQFFRVKKFSGGKVEFKPAGYLKLLGPSFKFLSFVLPYFPPLLWILDKLAGTRIPIISSLFGMFSVLSNEPVPYFLSDFINYMDIDPRSNTYEIRQKIMGGAVQELRELISDESYDQIIIVGHSLGSVIGYDALNRIIQELNADTIPEEQVKKIKGLITFGSPLDKFALFFKVYIDEDKQVQRKVLNHLHGFKASSLLSGENEDNNKEIYSIQSPIKLKLDSIRWLNFYHNKDLASGKLDFYDLTNQKFKNLPGLEGNGNILVDDTDKKISYFTAHGCYWGNHLGSGKGTSHAQKKIIEEFILN